MRVYDRDVIRCADIHDSRRPFGCRRCAVEPLLYLRRWRSIIRHTTTVRKRFRPSDVKGFQIEDWSGVDGVRGFPCLPEVSLAPEPENTDSG